VTSSDGMDHAPGGQTSSGKTAQIPDSLHGIMGFLALDGGIRLTIWWTSFAFTTAVMTALNGWPSVSPIGANLGGACRWGLCLAGWITLYNLIYVAELIFLRLLVPTPKEGRYLLHAGGFDRQLLWSCFVAVLTKARLEPPFPAFLVHPISSLPPMRWLMGPIFGPKSASCNVSDPRIVDPHLVTLGRNVVIGIAATISGHAQDRDTITMKRTVIEDNVTIGGHSAIYGGVHIQSGAIIGGGATVLPGTVIGPNEFWGGVPAKKLRDLPPLGQLPDQKQAD